MCVQNGCPKWVAKMGGQNGWPKWVAKMGEKVQKKVQKFKKKFKKKVKKIIIKNYKLLMAAGKNTIQTNKLFEAPAAIEFEKV
jgi:hypothetical protein